VKVKLSPEDFIVNELLPPGFIKKSGAFEVYALIKRGVTTLECVHYIEKFFGKTGYCGLKDKHGVTTQYITVNKGAELTRDKFKLRLIGYADNHLQRGDNTGNEFIITLQVTPEELKLIKKNEPLVSEGFINLFDTQRTSRELIHKSFTHYLIEGDYKTALLRYYINKSKLSNKRLKQAYKECFKNWGNASKCYSLLKGLEKNITLRPLREAISGDYLEAIKKIPLSELELLIAGHQSLLWNEEAKKTSKEFLELPVIKTTLLKNRKGVRRVKTKPEDLTINYKVNEVVLSFKLPRGAYATILIKELIKE
jgi:tRNA pseudouridine13 synthase